MEKKNANGRNALVKVVYADFCDAYNCRENTAYFMSVQEAEEMYRHGESIKGSGSNFYDKFRIYTKNGRSWDFLKSMVKFI